MIKMDWSLLSQRVVALFRVVAVAGGGKKSRVGIRLVLWSQLPPGSFWCQSLASLLEERPAPSCAVSLVTLAVVWVTAVGE